MRAFNLGQRLLARHDHALLLFDEVEDVFERDRFAELFGGSRGRAAGGKAWINRTLENNPVPALWLTNDAHLMNRAYLRRFDYAIRFHGPACTGKSELARHIADQVQKPLLVKRAWDLLDMYLGQTEQHLAAMFDEARQRDAVLVLDEADSFLRDRRDAHHSWEVTQVNELLTQMEAFDGIFIATTNLMESLDAASLRRFPWKIRFEPLKPNQRWALFAQEFARLGGELAEAAEYQAEVGRLERLTPGDVAAVVRQYELWDETPSTGEFYHRLAAEVAAKAAIGEAGTANRRSTVS